MATQEQINAAFELVFNTEKTAAVATVAAMDSFKQDIDAIILSLPDKSINPVLRQALAMIQSQLNMNMLSSIDQLKSFYGLNPPITPIITPVANSANG